MFPSDTGRGSRGLASLLLVAMKVLPFHEVSSDMTPESMRKDLLPINGVRVGEENQAP